MTGFSPDLAKAILKVMKENKLQWGKDVALLVSTDAVHYGDEDWGGKNYAPYGCDSAGYKSAVQHEHQIMQERLTTPDTAGAKKFAEYTVQSSDGAISGHGVAGIQCLSGCLLLITFSTYGITL